MDAVNREQTNSLERSLIDFIIRSLFDFFKDFFYSISVSFLVPLFRVCAFVTFFIKILCVTVKSKVKVKLGYINGHRL